MIYVTRNRLAILLLLLVVVAYLQGLGGAFFYDDYSNLKGLSEIRTVPDFLAFVGAGASGPLGRPIALFTFALQHAHWPHGGVYLLGVNVLIHAINATLVFYIAGSLSKLFYRVGRSEAKHSEFAFIAAAFWALTPILASSSLILVQRMTGLSALFSLLSIFIYLECFVRFNHSSVKRLIVQAFVLGIGTLLAMFSKENGALLPALVFAIEAGLLIYAPAAEKFRPLRLAVLSLSVLAFLVYVSPLMQPWFVVNDYRGFSPWERLQTEFVILWRYLFLTFFPLFSSLGPFQDHVAIISDKLTIAIAFSAWVLVFTGSFLARKRFPWLFFAVLWFLIGHLLESTTVLLELYFEHRNYLPLVGVALLFAALSCKAIDAFKNLARFAIYGYLIVLIGILSIFTNLWGQPKEASEFWYETNPASGRAIVHHVNLGIGADQSALASNMGRVLNFDMVNKAMFLLDKSRQWCIDCLDVYMQSFIYACYIRNSNEVADRFTELRNLIDKTPNLQVSLGAVDGAAILGKLVSEKSCKSLNYEDVDNLLSGFLQPGHRIAPSIKVRINYQQATLAYAMGRYELAEERITAAAASWPEAQPVTDFQIEFYLERGKPGRAMDVINHRLGLHERGEIHLPSSYIVELQNKLKEIKK